MIPVVAEASLAAVGLLPLLKGEVRWNDERRARARMLPKDIEECLTKFISGGSAATPGLPEFDFEEVAKLVTRGITPEAKAKLEATIDEGLADQVLGTATRILGLLKPKIPTPTRQTAFGAVPEEPSDKDKADFARLWSVANDPRCVFDCLLGHSLSADMIQALFDFWPGLTEATQTMIPQAWNDLQARRPTFRLAGDVDRMLAALLGRQPSPTTVALVQAIAATAMPAPAAPGQVDEPEAIKGDLATPGQGGSDEQGK